MTTHKAAGTRKPVIRCTNEGIFICQDTRITLRVNPLRGFGWSINQAYDDWMINTSQSHQSDCHHPYRVRKFNWLSK